MIRKENPNFVASQYAPNPKEVSYWIDLASDPSGNVVKSFKGDEWIPLNKDTNVDQYEKIKAVNEDLQNFKSTKAQPNGLASLDSDGKVPNSQIPNYLVELPGKLNQEVADRKAADKTLQDNLDDLEDRHMAFEATKGVAGGIASLNSNGKIPESQLPSYVDDVLEYTNLSSFPITGESGKIYVAQNTNLTYRWSGSDYIEISPSIALGENSSTAYPGDKGKAVTDRVASIPTTILNNSMDVRYGDDRVYIDYDYYQYNDITKQYEQNNQSNIYIERAYYDSVGLMGSTDFIALSESYNQIDSCLWYGVRFTDSSPKGRRTGNRRMHSTLPIQSKMRGCTINNTDDVIKYLDPENWSRWEDGTAVTADSNGYTPEYFVEIPEHYRLLVSTPNNEVEIRLSEYNLPGFEKVPKTYIAAYEAVETASVPTLLRSVPSNQSNEYIPTTNITLNLMQAYARGRNRSKHWNVYTYQAHKTLVWLFVVEFANRNTQDDLYTTKEVDFMENEFNQGGLGAGVTKSQKNGAYAFVPTGITHEYGNGTGAKPYSYENNGGNYTVHVPRYRGIENPFGHIKKAVIDVVLAGTDNNIYISTDTDKWTIDMTKHAFSISTTDGYISQIIGNNSADIFAKETSATSNTYYCDECYTNATTDTKMITFGGASNNSSSAGLFYYTGYTLFGNKNNDIGTRLTFNPYPVNAAS